MLFKKTIILACVAFSLTPLAVNAAAVLKEDKNITFSSDHSKQTSPGIFELSGNVVVKAGKSEIKTDEAKVTTDENTTTITTNEFVVTIKK